MGSLNASGHDEDAGEILTVENKLVRLKLQH